MEPPFVDFLEIRVGGWIGVVEELIIYIYRAGANAARGVGWRELATSNKMYYV